MARPQYRRTGPQVRIPMPADPEISSSPGPSPLRRYQGLPQKAQHPPWQETWHFSVGACPAEGLESRCPGGPIKTMDFRGLEGKPGSLLKCPPPSPSRPAPELHWSPSDHRVARLPQRPTSYTMIRKKTVGNATSPKKQAFVASASK